MKNNTKNLIIILFTTLLIYFSGCRAIYIKGHSMEPNIHDNSFGFICSIYPITRFSIVQVKSPVNDLYLCKRIIGLPGEKISLDGHRLFINDKEINYPYKDPNYSFEPKVCNLSNNEYWIMGDNSSDSLDSKYFGPIKTSEILGRIIWTAP